MRKPPTSRKPKNRESYSSSRQVPNMATPRVPEPPHKLGFFGALFVLGIFAGLIWFVMLIFGIGPYQTEVSEPTPIVLETQIIVLPAGEMPTQHLSLPSTPAFRLTSIPTFTVTPLPTHTQTPTPELRPYILYGEMESMSSVIIPQQKLGPDWLLIAGQVWDLQGKDVTGLKIHLYGELAGYEIDRYVESGSALAYGRSGYEIALEGMVVESTESLFIQLEGRDGTQLSHPYVIQTFNDPERNLILVNFKKVR